MPSARSSRCSSSPARRGLRVAHLDVKGADLEDVFLNMTGRKLTDDDEEASVAAPVRRRRFGRGGGH